ncbi:hypothetical protein ABZW11_17220 [Nonomuraea sp. NPDC004580]|uniref:hypothetical protein n=1 Tax=Nonomuraea sp. NPDC004580 TaxID=3154552 RepID=UPI0033BC7248
MAFPQDVLPLVVELYLDGAWVDVTSHVYRRDMVQIRRGRADEAGQVDHSSCTLTLNNRSGDYSPRNPVGAYYGQLGRNTPIRVAVEDGDAYLVLPGGDGDKMTCPDASGLGITGDLDVRIDLTLDDWHAVSDLACKWVATGNQRSWALYINANVLVLEWSADGTATTLSRWTTVEVPFPASGRQALRATLDVNNGSSGHTVTFYRADTIDGSWEQLGDPVVTAGTTSVFDSTAGIEVGDIAVFAGDATTGKLHAFELRNGIGGTVVANPDLSGQTPGDTSFADTASSPNTWTLEGDTEISNRRYRFHGEVSSWPPRWDISGQDVYTPVEAAGVLRRISRDDTVLGSAIYRGIIYASGMIAYWPMEDVEGSTSLAPAFDHGPLAIIGAPESASYEGFVASNALPVLRDAELRGNLPFYTGTGVHQVRFLLAVPEAGDGNDQGVLTIYSTGSVRRWEVHYGTGGTLGLRGIDAGGTTLFDTGDIAFAVDGERLLVAVELTQDGADIDYTLVTVPEGATVGSASSGTLASNTVGRIGSVIVNPGGGLDGTTVGHLSVQNVITTVFDLGSQLDAWRGETAGRRIERLCSEAGLAFRGVGDLDATARLGAQRPGTLIGLLRAAADTDAGMLFEPRDVLGLGYRTRESLYNQTARLALDYEAHELADAPSPVDDDQAIVNDVTVTREGGSSARAVQETGTLSVLDPPDGVGRYPQEVTLAVQYDLDLFEQAGWRLHLGTVDEARYPQLSLNLAHESFAGDADLTDAARLLEVGDRVTVSNPPPWLPPEEISQLVQGYAEELGNFEQAITLNCSPASPYEVATYDGTARYMPVDTVLNEALDTTETGVDITTPTGPLWSTAASGFDVMIGGERMTVSAVGSATGTAQTLTVTRSVNGVVKSHDSGTPVELFLPAIYAL